MELSRLEGLSFLLKGHQVAVEQADSEEEGLICAGMLEGNVEDFAHPVDHSCAEVGLDLVEGQVVLGQLVLLLESANVLIDLETIVFH